jgi:hypothetical protein
MDFTERFSIELIKTMSIDHGQRVLCDVTFSTPELFGIADVSKIAEHIYVVI